MKKIYVAMVCIALALFISCDEKKAEDDIKKAFTKITDKAVDVVDAVDKVTPKPTLTKPLLSTTRIRKEEPITFPKVAKHTYILKNPASFLTLSDVEGDTTKKQVSSTEVASGVIIVATFDGDSIESDPIDFLLYVANKKALQDVITNRLAEADGATADLNYIDTSDITDMSGLFRANSTFNGDISKWDTSSVVTMLDMFYGATSFNQPLNKWDVSKVEDMEDMFYGATSFNQDLTAWVDKSERETDGMFDRATAMEEENIPTWVE